MTKKMNIPFSPPDISEKEIEAVSEALRSGWITTGPRTKELDRWQSSLALREVRVLIQLQRVWRRLLDYSELEREMR